MAKVLRLKTALCDFTVDETRSLRFKAKVLRTKLAADTGGIAIWELDIPSGGAVWDHVVRTLPPLTGYACRK